MLQVLLSTKNYFFWLLIVSVFTFFLERIFTWRKSQKVLRKGIVQDLFFLIFNGHYAGILIAYLAVYVLGSLFHLSGLNGMMMRIRSLNLLIAWPIVIQGIAFLLIKDFVSWLTHILLHRVPWMWQFHKLHHSITELDWIGNFRFHWMEIIIYRAFTYFPLVILGVPQQVILVIAVIETLIGNLNHANIHWGYGFMGYILNSPRFHAWHHDIVSHDSKYGQNYAIIFSFWDRIFGTVYYPHDKEMPQHFGFKGMQIFPETLGKRLIYPLFKKKS